MNPFVSLLNSGEKGDKSRVQLFRIKKCKSPRTDVTEDVDAKYLRLFELANLESDGSDEAVANAGIRVRSKLCVSLSDCR